MPKTSRTKLTGYPVIVPFAYTGVALLFSWTYLMFYATSAGIKTPAPISLYSTDYSLSAISMVATLVVIGFFIGPRTKMLTSVAAKVTAGLLLPLSTALLLFNSMMDHLALLIVGSITTGIFSGILCMQWVAAYKRVGLRVAVSSFPALMAISVGICATLMYLPSEVMTISIIALPFISELMFHEVRKDPWPVFEDEEAGPRDRPINFTLMLLPFAVYALATGFLDYAPDGNSYTFVFYAFGALVPMVLAGVFLFKTDRHGFVSAFLVPLAFLIVVCVPFLAKGDLEPFSPFISIGELGIEVLLFIVPIGFAHFFSIDTLKTYALGRLVYVLFSAIGWNIGAMASAEFEALAFSQVSLVFIFTGVEVLVVCLIIAIVKAQKIDPGNQVEQPAAPGTSSTLQPLESTDVPNPTLQNSSITTLTTNCTNNSEVPSPGTTSMTTTQPGSAETLCLEYGLSKREQEVCLLLAKGYTSPRIQKELFIAAGTVNYHSRNIYTKLGVHSKQELIQLFETSLCD